MRSMRTKSLAELSLAAEARAVEEGHHAMLAGGCMSVVSDTTPGLHWMVKAFSLSAGEGIIFTCHADDAELAHGRGHLPLTSRSPGALPCKHAGLAARALSRAGLAQWINGSWVATEKAVQATRLPADPFKGLAA